jgi:hypothetical protein
LPWSLENRVIEAMEGLPAKLILACEDVYL